MNDLKEIKSVEDMLLYAQKHGGAPMREMLEKKSNENLDATTNANWYDAYGIKNAIKDMTAERGQLLAELKEGYEGNSLPDSYPVPYDITNNFMLGKTQWRDTARPAFAATALTDAKGTIAPVEFILQFGITDQMIAMSTDAKIFDYIVSKASKAAVSTMEGCIINGDTETGGTGNVNSDDQAPATTFGSAQYHSLKIDHGIRESAINNSMTYDVSAFDSDDIGVVRGLLAANYATQTSELLCIFEPSTYMVAMTDDAFKLAANTRNASVDGGVLTPYGIKAIAHDLMPKTEADGKMSATPASNTKGCFAVVYKPAIRWGFGKDVLIETERVQGYGFEITVTMKFGFVILDATHTCAVGRDITVS